jgi:DNA-directed RNA polymerase subunit N
MIPVRCFSCNNLIAHKYKKWLVLKQQEVPEDKIFKILNIRRYCCKRMFISGYDYSYYL